MGIGELDEGVMELNKKVEEVRGENEGKRKSVEGEDKGVKRGWYVLGSKCELKEEKILKKGEVVKENDLKKD